FFKKKVRDWAHHPRVRSRLADFGIPTAYIRPLLRQFTTTVENGELPAGHGDWEKYGLARFGQALDDAHSDHIRDQLDVIYSTIFFSWAGDARNHARLAEMLAQSTSCHPTEVTPRSALLHIQRLLEAASRQYPAEEYPLARKMHRRIIMHVGPTNSGKTHHALRALAAARTGVYAGPLRLLAHEIWERLNLGEIKPLNVEEDPNSQETSVAIPEHLEQFPSLLRVLRSSSRGNLVYSRPCNMITGEEQKIVMPGAPLLACTVEMLSFTRTYDVAVVDEIQMIGDPERGGGWTAAVLGLCAHELHLCGEETAVPVVQSLLRETGDEIEVRRYERLTPLTVEEDGLNGNYQNVQKGDCVVAFSRGGIFGIRKAIEQKTGMKCAVVYGKLPPEIRSEQARLFNDPTSGYDVIIGSDAIGMGLNLKIRRIIFDSVSKWTGNGEKLLSTSQIKQIAGRAGRFGLLTTTGPPAHLNPNDLPTLRVGGSATTLYSTDIPVLQRAIAAPITPLSYARLSPHADSFSRIAHVLPRGSSTFTVYEAHVYAGRLSANYRYNIPSVEDGALSELDLGSTSSPGNLTIADRLLLCLAPVQWRDPMCVEVVKRLIEMYKQDLEVDLAAAVKGTGFMEALECIELEAGESIDNTQLQGHEQPDKHLNQQNSQRMGVVTQGSANHDNLNLLETFHKVLVMYIWMSYRNSVSWGNREDVQALKERVERALEYCLEHLS
ncbi:hypothetical protein AMATHDRAFT_122125, partial [Amanita thiersii Skay4041]